MRRFVGWMCVVSLLLPGPMTGSAWAKETTFSEGLTPLDPLEGEDFLFTKRGSSDTSKSLQNKKTLSFSSDPRGEFVLPLSPSSSIVLGREALPELRGEPASPIALEEREKEGRHEGYLSEKPSDSESLEEDEGSDDFITEDFAGEEEGPEETGELVQEEEAETFSQNWPESTEEEGILEDLEATKENPVDENSNSVDLPSPPALLKHETEDEVEVDGILSDRETDASDTEEQKPRTKSFEAPLLSQEAAKKFMVQITKEFGQAHPVTRIYKGNSSLQENAVQRRRSLEIDPSSLDAQPPASFAVAGNPTIPIPPALPLAGLGNFVPPPPPLPAPDFRAPRSSLSQDEAPQPSHSAIKTSTTKPVGIDLSSVLGEMRKGISNLKKVNLNESSRYQAPKEEDDLTGTNNDLQNTLSSRRKGINGAHQVKGSSTQPILSPEEQQHAQQQAEKVAQSRAAAAERTAQRKAKEEELRQNLAAASQAKLTENKVEESSFVPSETQETENNTTVSVRGRALALAGKLGDFFASRGFNNPNAQGPQKKSVVSVQTSTKDEDTNVPSGSTASRSMAEALRQRTAPVFDTQEDTSEEEEDSEEEQDWEENNAAEKIDPEEETAQSPEDDPSSLHSEDKSEDEDLTQVTDQVGDEEDTQDILENFEATKENPVDENNNDIGLPPSPEGLDQIRDLENGEEDNDGVLADDEEEEFEIDPSQLPSTPSEPLQDETGEEGGILVSNSVNAEGSIVILIEDPLIRSMEGASSTDSSSGDNVSSFSSDFSADSTGDSYAPLSADTSTHTAYDSHDVAVTQNEAYETAIAEYYT